MTSVGSVGFWALVGATQVVACGSSSDLIIGRNAVAVGSAGTLAASGGSAGVGAGTSTGGAIEAGGGSWGQAGAALA